MTVRKRLGEYPGEPAPDVPLEEIDAIEEILLELHEESHERIEGCLEGVADEHGATRVEIGAHAEALHRSIEAAQRELLSEIRDEIATLREEFSQQLDDHRQAMDERLVALEGAKRNGDGDTGHGTTGTRSR